jgi:hypothetical protein
MAIQIILGTDFNWHPAKVNGYRVKSYIDVSIPFFF